MTDESKQSGTLDDDAESFDDRVSEIRDENDNELETEYGILSEEYNGVNKDNNDSTDGWLIVSLIGVVFGLIGAVANPEDAIFAFFVVGATAASITWLYTTPSGEQFREEIAEQQQQDAISTGSTEAKQTCPNCGWQNPARNNYCHDCGEKIG